MSTFSRLRTLVRIKQGIAEKTTPRWVLFLADIGIVGISVYLAYLLRFNFRIPKENYDLILFSEILFILVRLVFFALFRVYSHIIRYTSITDIRRIFITISQGTITLFILSVIARFTHAFPILPFSIIAIEFFISLYLISNLRILARSLYLMVFNLEFNSKKALIFGSRDLAVIAKEALELNPSRKFKVQAFFDSNPRRKKNKLMGLAIHPIADLPNLINKYKITHLVFAERNASDEDKELIVEICLQQDVKMLTIPDAWLHGNISSTDIREVNVEDVLNREPINLNKENIEKALMNQIILITGAAGSIGSEIVRQVAHYAPRKIILVDQAETPLYDIELELEESYNFKNYEAILADIANPRRMEKVFELFKPDIVYHAAAYKHVPMMENNPSEAIHNNVIGTRILADLANKHKVRKFVMVSTDKAVNPTGIMGATKRMAEMYIQSLNEHSKTSFITTRFGNVLYSNGSVLPRFLKQIKEGGPVTVTHPEITRYFMTIPEACQLVLEASVMGHGGEIYLFDMGKAIKILDLAKSLIKFSGNIVEKDIKIKFTGLRPGEKLYEELLMDSENNKPTHHPKIKIAEVCSEDYQQVSGMIDSLSEPLLNQNILKLVKQMKQMVPTYKSKNSDFEKLDAVI